MVSRKSIPGVGNWLGDEVKKYSVVHGFKPGKATIHIKAGGVIGKKCIKGLGKTINVGDVVDSLKFFTSIKKNSYFSAKMKLISTNIKKQTATFRELENSFAFHVGED